MKWRYVVGVNYCALAVFKSENKAMEYLEKVKKDYPSKAVVWFDMVPYFDKE